MTVLVCSLRAERFGDVRMADEPRWFRDSGDPITAAEAALMMRGQRVLVFVPGYRAENDRPRDAGDGFAHNMSDLGYQVLVVVQWSNGRTRTLFPLTRLRVPGTAEMLDLYAWGVMAQAKSLTVIAHSLGCAVMLRSRVRLGCWDRTILAGAAVPADSVLPIGYEVAWTSNDSVLRWAYRLASWGRAALGQVGPRPKRGAIEIDLTGRVLDHSGYWACPDFQHFARCRQA